MFPEKLEKAIYIYIENVKRINVQNECWIYKYINFKNIECQMLQSLFFSC